jgi:hypothetical protein
MKFKVSWVEHHVGSFTVDTEEEAKAFTEQPSLDDPRFQWDQDRYLVDYEELYDGDYDEDELIKELQTIDD